MQHCLGPYNTLQRLRREFEPCIPVVGTVPAIKPAAASGGPVAVWATIVTTGSDYQQDLIRRFANGIVVSQVPCTALATAVEHADLPAVEAAIADAVAHTPAGSRALVLGSTHYALVADRIQAALPSVALFDSAHAVAAQALRRACKANHMAAARAGAVTVLLGGKRGNLPPAALQYAAGRDLASAHAVCQN